jgi:hypothetical protein
MPHTMETTVFTFDELSPEAKEKAREWYREGALDYEWYDATFEDAARVADILGVSFRGARGNLNAPAIYYSGFSSQGDGACFEGSYSYKAGLKKAIRAYAPKDAELHRIADALQDLQRKHAYRLVARVKHRGHYYHSCCTVIDVWDAETDRPIDATAGDALCELLRDFMDWIYRQLEREADYLLSDESVDETIRANEYTFTEDGRRFA